MLAGCGPVPEGAGPAPVTTAPTSPASSPTRATPAPTPTPTPTPSATPDSATEGRPQTGGARALLQAGDRGEKVRELQHRLRQLDWFSGPITGTYGKATTKGVKGFQGKRKITKTGDVDRRTWAVLIKMTRTPTRAERHNSSCPGPAIMGQGSSGRPGA